MAASAFDVDPFLPRTRASLSLFPLDDDLVIYDPLNGESYILNPTGRFVWEHCDGTRTPGEIASGLAERHGIPINQALADTRELLEAFGQSNLLQR